MTFWNIFPSVARDKKKKAFFWFQIQDFFKEKPKVINLKCHAATVSHEQEVLQHVLTVASKQKLY